VEIAQWHQLNTLQFGKRVPALRAKGRQVQHRKDTPIMPQRAQFVNTTTIIGFTGKDMTERDYARGFQEARNGFAFDPSAHGYKAGSKGEYDYARGYADENNVNAATAVLANWEREHSMQAYVEPNYEEDGNILYATRGRHAPKRN
jgi:hypothetical protein